MPGSLPRVPGAETVTTCRPGAGASGGGAGGCPAAAVRDIDARIAKSECAPRHFLAAGVSIASFRSPPRR